MKTKWYKKRYNITIDRGMGFVIKLGAWVFVYLSYSSKDEYFILACFLFSLYIGGLIKFKDKLGKLNKKDLSSISLVALLTLVFVIYIFQLYNLRTKIIIPTIAILYTIATSRFFKKIWTRYISKRRK